ncbi:NADP-dependent succinic semialdehyde dehydrogenase [Longibacter salinarum]|uniref:NADP-dependent succinic semialdehyde dehydrogenase n=1 Tax=Longibacter salinarum TaxID=1850348 RepID=A0A2A8D054_9BACT|nr:NAD-dependent succinate-semialdehyde dehydrogenase [Longibacter salinarum]PEN14296.1 NADP-dependent succinic semialdehyde dehydrogenase [Longibacter salinarum]
MAYQTVSPTTGEEIARYSTHDADEIDERLNWAMEAFKDHRDRTYNARAERLETVADLLEKRAREYGELMTREMGKPIDQAVSEAEKCAWVCRYYAQHAESFLADEPEETPAKRSFVAYEPLGPIFAVMPWNFPFWQAFRCAAPALMAGNVVLLKHASNVQGCADAMEDLFKEAGFENHEFQVVRPARKHVSDIIQDRRVRGSALTGSVAAGSAIGREAGDAIKPSVLELGGSDPFIVLDDADLDRAVDIGVTARMQNNGQSCIAAKRFILHSSIAKEFTRRFISAVEDLKVGDPMDDMTDIGPMAREDLRDTVHDQVERAIRDGAVAEAGGHSVDRDGFFYKPTVLTEVERGTVAFDEEIFGPVASLIVAEDAREAVDLANDTRFGLGASIFTEDREKGERLARRVEAGCVFVNEMVKSDPRLPFGGVKDSGYGRELSRHGIREFVNAKTIWVE